MAQTKTKTTAPKHLAARGKAYFALVMSDFRLEADQVELLTAACEMLDVAEESRKQTDKDGRFITDRFGQAKEHPAVAVQRQSLVEFRQLRRELGIDVEEAARPRGPTSTNFG